MNAKSIALGIALSLAIASACSDDEDRVTTPSDSSGGEGAEAGAPSGGAGPEAAGGSSFSAAGSSSTGGIPTPQGGALHAGGAGAGSDPGNEAGMPTQVNGGTGGAGGTPGAYSGIEKLSLCPRLSRQTLLASSASLSFDSVVYSHPCVGWTTELYEVEQARPDYLNVLKAWSPGFWGCKTMGVESFALLWKQPDVLTQGDANLLITLYMQVLNYTLEADNQVALSPAEVTEMRAALERLSQTMVTDPTLDFSHPECVLPPVGEGGAGGVGSVSNDLAGAGGQGAHSGAELGGL